MMTTASIRIWPELPKAVIAPEIYGHFIEHLGRCVYEGIWVGEGSRIPNEDGVRLDVLAALKQLRAPIVRWPGGCFADTYHWRDGIGPCKDRPATVNIWWGQEDSNAFGTEEYLHFCRAVGCEPYICANVGSGSPQEALEWLEYCNHGGDSALSRLRGQKPHGVRYWGIGNENWGCGGNYRADDYAKTYVRFATYLRQADPSIQLVACGCSPMDYQNEAFVNWNHDFCTNMPHAHLMDHLSIHRYFGRGQGKTFSDSEYRALFGDLITFERDLQLADHLLGYFYPEKKVGLAVDEWGMWHPAATVENGLEQENTLRDAVFAGAVLNLFNQYAHRVTMANIAQTINVLQSLAITDGERMCLTPTYHTYDMMRPHMGAHLLTLDVSCDTYEAHPVGLKQKMAVPEISVSASLLGNKIHMTVANQTPDNDIETRIQLRDVHITAITGRILNATNAHDANTIAAPKTVAPKRLRFDAIEKEFVHTFPSHSFTALTLTLG